MAKRVCTWLIEAKYHPTKRDEKTDERVVVPAHDCGSKAVVEFSKDRTKEKGKLPVKDYYPRCQSHATDAARTLAITDKYASRELTE